ncbi:hypothetical protein BBF96_00090 [Anoxybacter fermentans]|uniref:CAAX prenyl protease 2/Lysostaphin resistance protein A-like domain-containing protein n=1 Tax=Anoxybacter fermentans TaxID=1323375 RepID=A0A3Q9HNK4_9FIRM|nr:type II CAAX endopeptidase family protein [Anoxybacter fermentans]AZR71944.1 hypothetical protein BBF96_00090 [Anoxybacter fermentans]
MTKDLQPKPQLLSLNDLIIIYIVWFFLAGIYEMTQQLIFEGSPFLTRIIHYLFFITIRLLFIPIVLYLICYRRSLDSKLLGLTLRKFWVMSKIGIKASWPIIPLVLLFIHLPLVYTNTNLRPMIKVTSPEEIAVSLVYFIILFIMTIIPSLSEELLFRGLTFPFLKERLALWQALLLNAIIYGIFYIQFNIYHLFLRIVLGFFTTYLFWRSKSLIPSTILQAFFHATFILYIFGWGFW